MADESRPVPFADFVGALREQLRQAQTDTDSEMPIEVGKVTVEFTVLSRQEGEGKTGVKFWVVDASVSGKLAHETTQKVTMELHPLDPGGTRPARVSDHDAPDTHAGGPAGSDDRPPTRPRGDVERD